MPTLEINFDGLVGNTHNYAGLAIGNKASLEHAFIVSNPKAAALEGLHKMKLLADLGLKQAIIPPHPRPAVGFLRRLGFSGSLEVMLRKVYQQHPTLFAACYSASGMWTANAATISPSSDTFDNRVHITSANLAANLHRSLEAEFTMRVLRRIFADPRYFTVHDPLPTIDAFCDEGAANHTRFSVGYEQAGVELFVYGRSALTSLAHPKKFPARQTREAAEAIARLHQLQPTFVVYAQQNPAVIDQGVFHNDVIAVGNQQLFLYHEEAFVDTPLVLEQLQNNMHGQLIALPVRSDELSVADAVASYLFNSQIVSLADGSMAIIAPRECEMLASAKRVVERLLQEDNPIKTVHYVDCRQSMQNGGGPACLRLRVVLSEVEQRYVQAGVYLTDSLYQQLCVWVEKHYREQLAFTDLFSADLFEESQRAFEELEVLLGMRGLYEGWDG